MSVKNNNQKGGIIMRKRNSIYLVLLLSIFTIMAMVTSVNAVKLDLGTNMSISGVEMYIDNPAVYVDSVIVNDTGCTDTICLYNASWTNGNLQVNATSLINWTTGNVLSSQFPRFSSSDDFGATFASSLSAVTGTYNFPVDTCDTIGNIIHKSGGAVVNTYQTGGYTCSNNRVSLVFAPSNGDTLEISYGCSSTAKLGFNLIMILSALAVVAFVIIYIRWKDGFENLEVKDYLILFTGITLAVVFWLTAGQSLGGACGVIG